MEPKYLDQLVSTNPESTSVNDINEPFSFMEWRKRVPTIVEEQATNFYNKYLVEWFKRNKQQKVSQKFLIRQRYLYLLDQLQLFFKDEEKDFWYSKINLSDEKDLLLSIPYFAKKLKNVALYYLKLRKRLKNTKLKYNLVGTSTGLEQEVYDLLLETFTDFNKEVSPDIAATLPSLSSIRDSLVVKVQETYDDFDYFDKSPQLNSNHYYDLFHEATAKYFNEKNIDFSSSEWLLRSLTVDPTKTYSTFTEAITGDIFETTTRETYESFFKSYLAENKYTETFFTSNTSARVYEIFLDTGTNNFYYPYGAVDESLVNNTTIQTVNLSSLQLQGATSGTTPSESDIIVVKNGTDYQAAWCYYKQFDDRSETMSAIFPGNVATRFRFPYPGYGLSGQNMEWTGLDIATSSEYFFFKNDIKNAVDKAYWSEPLPAASVDSIYINNSTLLTSKATSSKNPNSADKIYLETNDETDLQKPTVSNEASWLYALDKAFWPVANDKPNTFLWPLHLALSGNVYSDLDVSSFCDPISIHNLNTNLSIAASSIDLADKIYKVTNSQDPIGVATECCWLSSSTADSGKYRINSQDGFSSIFWPDVITRFVWTGPTTPLSAVFASKVHKKECPFSTNIPKLQSKVDWNKCTCKEVFHAPFGHPGKSYNEYNQQADFIAVDASNTMQPFSYDTWRDDANKDFTNSSQFAWFKTTSELGWGRGNWSMTDTSAVFPFDLEYGKSYFYKRCGSREEEQFPFYSVNYAYPGVKKSKWVGAFKNENGEWVSSDGAAAFTLRSGDYLKYERQNQTTNYFISSEMVEDAGENRGSVWSTLDYVVSGTYQDTTYIMWPTQPKPLGSTDPQYPSFDFMSLSALDFWEIQSNEVPSLSTRIYSPYKFTESTTITTDSSGKFVATPSIEKVYNNKVMFAFTPPVTGTYSIRVSANGQWFTAIPNLTVVPQFKEVEKVITIDVPSSGFILEQQLYGWNYTLGKSQKGARGAKPYWAELYVNRQTPNRYKAAPIWGYPDNFVDSYLPDQSPRLSLIKFEFGNVVRYERYGYEMQWDQPITFKEYSGTTQWCVLTSYPTTLQLNRQDVDIEAYGTYEPTPIQLSNRLNGLPVEVSYDALNSFVWKVSTYDTETENTNVNSLLYKKNRNYVNLENRFFNTVATIPTLEKNYTEETVGGYFLPQHIGASQYVNDNFNVSLKTVLSSGTFTTEDTKIHIGGRGRSKQDQPSLYKWNEQNEWLKSAQTSEQKAGSVKNELTKTLQTFIPYQPNSEIVSLGATTTQTKLSPWGGKEQTQWTDYLNEPNSFTGIPNVSAWAATQIFKNQELSLDQWTSDIFGNQYALYKNLSGSSVSDYTNIDGQLWTRLNGQAVLPSNVSLSAAFSVFQTKPFYSEIFNQQIKTIDCFLDTLFFETETAVGLIPIDYDYSESTISVLLDNVALIEYLNPQIKRFEKTWFFPTQKQVFVLTTELIPNSFIPTLHVFDLTKKSFVKGFPITVEDTQRLQEGLSGINVFSIDEALLHYNSTYQTFLITYKGVDTNAKMFIIDFEIEQKEKLTLEKVDRYI